MSTKRAVHDFWEEASCGEVYARGSGLQEQLEAQAAKRYELEPFIHSFARFPEGRGKRVLEVGVGMGADHLEWARSQPECLVGIDLTERAIRFTRSRLAALGGTSNLQVADAEHLPFADDTFDIVYSWGVLHHSPATDSAIAEVRRVLRPGGRASVMIYHSRSVVGLMLWTRYGFPSQSLADVYASHLESPGTKAFTVAEARAMFSGYSAVDARIELSPGDLMLGAAGQRHQGLLLDVARRMWPRSLIRAVARQHGLFLLITATK